MCDATNSIGTRSASVEVSVIGGFFSVIVNKSTGSVDKVDNATDAASTTPHPFPSLRRCLFLSSAEKPLPQIATGDVISVIALLLAAGVLMGITITVLVLKIRSRNKQSSYVYSLYARGDAGILRVL